MDWIKNKIQIVLFVFSVASCVFFNELNLEHIRSINPDNIQTNGYSIQRGEMVFSIDSEYYLSPVENYVKGDGWKRSPTQGNGGYFRRMPGYSLIYFCFYKISGFDNALFFLKIFQVLFFGLSIVFFYKTLLLLSGKWKFALCITLPFAFLPYFSGYSYMAITEGITPGLCIMFLYFVLKNRFSEEKRFYNLILASFFFIFLVFTRPYMAALGMILMIETVYFRHEPIKEWFSAIKRLSIVFLIPLLFISIWTIRNYRLTGEFVPLEKAFHPQTLDRMKPEFIGMISLSKCWGEDGFDFDVYYHPLLYGALDGDTSFRHVKFVVDSWPDWFVDDFGEKRMLSLVKWHQQVIYSQKKYYDEGIAMPKEYMGEQIKIKEEYLRLIDEFKSRYPFIYYVKSPLIYLKRNIFHSHTSKLAYFSPENSGWFQKTIKGAMYIIHILVYSMVFYNLIFMKSNLNKLVFVLTPLILIIFFCFIHREIEQRYLLPILPLLIISAVFPLIDKWKSGYWWRLGSVFQKKTD